MNTTISFKKQIIFLLLPILFFSCQTRLEKQGWQRIAIVSQLDTSTIKKDKELVVQKKYADKSSYYYRFYISENDSTGKTISREFASGFFLNSDIAYYKFESDTACLLKLMNQGNVQTSIKLGFGSWSGLEVLDEPKKSLLEKQGLRGTVIASRADTSAIKKDKELVVERMQLEGSYYYLLIFVEKDPTGKLINKPSFGFENSFKSDMTYYKWESDSMCLVKLLNQGNVWASVKLGFTETRKSLYILNVPKK